MKRPIPDDRERVVIIRNWLEAALILLPEPRLGIALHTRGKREAFEEALAFINGLGALSEQLAQCTGIAASWCPICGDCSCHRNPDGERNEESERCPLHGESSRHAESEGR